MKVYLKRLPKEIKDLINLASEVAFQNNLSAYLVGGFVRDLILGVKNLDLDIVIEGSGIKFAEALTQRLKVRLICHKRFGTATVIVNPKLKIDIATSRKESYPEPAFLPEVIEGSLEDDLHRRDFTINAMAISINRKDFGRLIDLFNGRSDLRHKKIRVLHRISFIDDPTRMLRAIRFEKRYNFKIDTRTLKLLKEAVTLKMLEKVQPQRVRDEFILLLKEKHPLAKYIRRIEKLVGFNFIDAQLRVSLKTYRLLASIRNQMSWFKRLYPERRRLDAWLIYFMGLLDPLDEHQVKSICKKFALRKGEEKRILSYKKFSPQFIRQLSKRTVRPPRIFHLLEPLSYEVIILLKARYKNPYLRRHIEDFFEIYHGMRVCVSGYDLHRLGVTPGADYQRIFACVLKAKLEGKIRTPSEELALIKKLIKHR